LGELYFNASSIFEFGLGESTYIASETNVPRYAGVDSDPGWVAMAREGATSRPTLNQDSWTAEEQARKGAHFRFYFADIGPTRKWGYPKQIKSDVLQKHLRRKVNAFNYQFTSLQVEQEPFDFYMVDGRYRVACALLSFLHGMQHGGDMAHVQVAIHDRNCKGRGYETLLDVADIVHESKRLWVLRLKSSTTEQELLALWEHNMFSKA
jgi:protein O-GlcNAc transferase